MARPVQHRHGLYILLEGMRLLYKIIQICYIYLIHFHVGMNKTYAPIRVCNLLINLDKINI